MQKSSNWKIILLSLISFILLGSYMVPAITSLRQSYGAPYIARVGKKNLTSSDLEIKNIFNNDFNYDENPIEDLIIKELLTQDAKRWNVKISREDLRQYITRLPIFSTNGKFDSAKFDYFCQKFINRDRLVAILADQACSNILLRYLQDTEYIYPAEIEESAFLLQERKFYYKDFPVESYLTQVSCTDDELLAFYIQHAANYFTPECADLSYLELEIDKYYKPVQEEQIINFYRTNKNSFKQEERRSGLVLKIPESLTYEIENAIKYQDELPKKYHHLIVDNLKNIELKNAYGISKILFQMEKNTLKKYKNYFVILQGIEQERIKSFEESAAIIKELLEEERIYSIKRQIRQEISSQEKAKRFLDRYLNLIKKEQISQNTPFKFKEIKQSIFNDKKPYGLFFKNDKIIVFSMDNLLPASQIPFKEALPQLVKDLKFNKAQKLARDHALAFVKNPVIEECSLLTTNRFNKKIPHLLLKEVFSGEHYWELIALNDKFTVYQTISSHDVMDYSTYSSLMRRLEILSYLNVLSKTIGYKQLL